jgi:8-oxo-dGTP diphosphatase
MTEDKFFGMKHKQDTPKVGVAVIVKKAGKFLLLLRKGSHGAGLWSLPGGHVDVGEESKETCSRELFEELGVEISSIHFWPWGFQEYINEEEGLHYVTLKFLVDLDSKPLSHIEPFNAEVDKCERMEWVDAESAPSKEDFFNYETYAELMSMDCFRSQ